MNEKKSILELGEEIGSMSNVLLSEMNETFLFIDYKELAHDIYNNCDGESGNIFIETEYGYSIDLDIDIDEEAIYTGKYSDRNDELNVLSYEISDKEGNIIEKVNRWTGRDKKYGKTNFSDSELQDVFVKIQ